MKEGRPIIGAGAGTGLSLSFKIPIQPKNHDLLNAFSFLGISAKFEERGGADLLVIYNRSYFLLLNLSVFFVLTFSSVGGFEWLDRDL